MSDFRLPSSVPLGVIRCPFIRIWYFQILALLHYLNLAPKKKSKFRFTFKKFIVYVDILRVRPFYLKQNYYRIDYTATEFTCVFL